MLPTCPPPRRSCARTCLLGDACTVGAGDETALGGGRVVQAEWQRHHDVTISNLGIRGASTRVLRRRWRQECAARLPCGVQGRLVFMFGGNDAKEVVGTGLAVPLEESVANTRAIMAAAAAWLPTLWLSRMPMRETRPYPRLAARNARGSLRSSASSRVHTPLRRGGARVVGTRHPMRRR